MIERLDAAALAHPAADVLEMFDWLGAAIDADAAAGRFALWGRSTVIDENVGAPVLSREIFEALHARAALSAAWPVGNAGLLHVYGYLLSTTPTPYGLKRERWLDGALARACGLRADAFVPWASADTVLDRVTRAASALLDRATGMCEQVDDMTARTALSSDAGPAALAYAVTDPTGATRLITMFPIADADAVRTQITTDGPRLRWNAVA